MDPAIQRNPIAIRHPVLGDDDRKLVAFRHELRPPVEDVRRNLPQEERVGIARSKFGMDRVAIGPGLGGNARVGIETIEIQRLAHCFQIGRRELRHSTSENA